MATTIKMTPINGGTSLTKTSADNRITFTAIPKGTYTVTVTEDGYENFTQQMVVDDDVENFTVELVKTSSGGIVVFDSKLGQLSFTESSNYGYLRAESIKLQPNTKYVVSTSDIQIGNSVNSTAPNLFANNTKTWTANEAVTPTKTQTVTTDSSGYIYIAGKPALDPEVTRTTYNVDEIKKGTYSFVIKTA